MCNDIETNLITTHTNKSLYTLRECWLSLPQQSNANLTLARGVTLSLLHLRQFWSPVSRAWIHTRAQMHLEMFIHPEIPEWHYFLKSFLLWIQMGLFLMYTVWARDIPSDPRSEAGLKKHIFQTWELFWSPEHFK